ncbi:MAG TPA: glycosyltransferase family 39 protein, partial [Candidatus Limnocylindrales bacterium]|nr:glycosyltransferase family 39 protein [Candidatus Limnocylindrales bacterium]
MKRPDTDNRWWFAAAVIAAAVVGVAVRLAGAGDRTLFWDEAYHVRLALEPTVGAVLGAVLANPPSDPLYSLVLYGWTALAGTSDFAVRLPSIAFAALTVVATAWLALELTASPRVAVLAAVLVALAPYAVEYGQEASLYSLATLTTTLALAAGWRWRASGRRGDAALAIVLAIVAIYSHYVVAAVLALAGALSLARLAGPRSIGVRQVAIAASIVLIVWLPWLVPMLFSWIDTDVPRTALPHGATVAELLGALSQYASGSGALLEGVRPLQVMG